MSVSDRQGNEHAELRGDIVAAARAFVSLSYVHAFGHVSARAAPASILITPTRPSLAAQTPADILEVGLDGNVIAGNSATRPIEAFLHLGIYGSRPDVNAICRAHPPSASLWWGDEAPPVEHGFGGLVGEVATYSGSDLIHTDHLGAAAAEDLGNASALLLRGNGALTVGRDVGEAAARMWSLEERCSYALRRSGDPAPFTEQEQQLRARWYPAESARIWAWLKTMSEPRKE